MSEVLNVYPELKMKVYVEDIKNPRLEHQQRVTKGYDESV